MRKYRAGLDDILYNMDKVDSARVIKAVTNTPLDIPEEAEVIDMCKAVDKGMELGEIHLVEKTGGKSGHYIRAEGGYV